MAAYRPLLSFAVLLLLFYGCRDQPVHQTSGKTRVKGAMGKKAMVVTGHPEATRVGREILLRGGNAVDAAVGVHFALAVTFPYAGNLGGGGFMVFRGADGNAGSLDFRERAPLLATRDMYLNDSGAVIPGLSVFGHLSVGVPGSVDGLYRAHDSLGSLPWRELLAPAIRLAREGYVVTAHQAFWLNKQDSLFKVYNPDNSYLQKASGWVAGDTLRQEDLAQTLERIRDQGRAGFYAGRTADLLIREIQSGGGIISQDDLDAYQSVWREPVRGRYRGHEVIAMGPPSSGGIALLQMLAMVERFPLKTYGPLSANAMHVMVEAERRAFADRVAHLGDPGFYPVPVSGLLDKAYLTARSKEFEAEGMAKPSDLISTYDPGPAESEETTHYSILDTAGNAVSITTTLNDAYGSRVFVDGAGFLLNDEMDDFTARPGTANMYGLIGAEANAIVPGKRMVSSMTPTIVTKDGAVFMVVGTPGGTTIITSVFQAITDVVDHGMSMQEAVNLPRFHHQWKPDKLYIENDKEYPDSILKVLETRGHVITPRKTFGRIDAILVHPDGWIEGAADPRRDDKADGF